MGKFSWTKDDSAPRREQITIYAYAPESTRQAFEGVCGWIPWAPEGVPPAHVDMVLFEYAPNMTLHPSALDHLLKEAAPSVFWFTGGTNDIPFAVGIAGRFDHVFVSREGYAGLFPGGLSAPGAHAAVLKKCIDIQKHNAWMAGGDTAGVYSPYPGDMTADRQQGYRRFCEDILAPLSLFGLSVNAPANALIPALKYFAIDENMREDAYRKSELLTLSALDDDSEIKAIEAAADLKLICAEKGAVLPDSLREHCLSTDSGREAIAWALYHKNNPEYRVRKKAEALRRVMLEHTSMQALETLMRHTASRDSVQRPVTVFSFPKTKAQLDRVLDAYNMQEYPQKTLCLVTELEVSDGLTTLSPAEAEELVIPAAEELLAVFDPEKVYHSYYLFDLVMAYCSTASEIITSAEKGFYTLVRESRPAESIFTQKVVSGYSVAELALLTLEGAIPAIYECAPQLIPKAAEKAPEVRYIFDHSGLYADDLTIPLEFFNRENPSADIAFDGGALEVSVRDDTKNHFYISPAYHKSSFACPPEEDNPLFHAVSAIGRDEFELHSAYSADEGIDITVMLAVYDNIKQLGTLSQRADGKTQLQRLPEGAKHILPLIRVSGQGNFTIKEISLKKPAVSSVWQRHFYDNPYWSKTRLGGAGSVYLIEQAEQHVYLRPKTHKGAFTNVPAENYIPELLPGGSYSIRVDGFKTGTVRLLAVVIIYDSKGEVQRVNCELGKTQIFTLSEEALFVLPLMRIQGQGLLKINDCKIEAVSDISGETEEIAPKQTNPYYLMVVRHAENKHNLDLEEAVYQKALTFLGEGLPVRVYAVAEEYAFGAHYKRGKLCVTVGSLAGLMETLIKDTPEKVLVLDAYREMVTKLNELKAFIGIPMIIWLKGQEILQQSSMLFNFKNEREFFHAGKEVILYNQFVELMLDPNTKFILRNEALREDISRIYGVELPAEEHPAIYAHMPPTVYHGKEKHQRKNILCIMDCDSFCGGADIALRVIEELAGRDFFSDLTISLYGSGKMFYEISGNGFPYPNVHITERVLSSAETAAAFSGHGILLCPMRYPTQSELVTTAMSYGLVPVSSRLDSAVELIGGECGMLSAPENAAALADDIEYLYLDAEDFSRRSQSAVNMAREKYNWENTIYREIEVIRNAKYQRPPEAAVCP